MATPTTGQGDDILLNVRLTGRDQIQGARADAQALNKEMANGGKQDIAAPAVSLKQQLRQAIIYAQQLAAAGKENTREFTDAAKNVAKIKDKIEELNATFKAFDPDNKFRVFQTAAKAGVGLVQGYAGAMAFLGVNSKDATETLAKLQGLMAFSAALDSLHDLKDSYRDLLRLLGLNKTATVESTAAVTENTAVVSDNAATQIALEDEVATARETADKAMIAADEAMIAVRQEGLDATVEMTTAEQTYLEAAAARQAAVEGLVAAETALAEAQGAATVTAEGEAVAMEATAVGEEAATGAAYGLGAALKAIGIGFIIAALAYLVTNFQTVKKTVTDLFPSLKNLGDVWNKFKEIVFGVGNVILQYIIAPLKAIIDVVKGDFKQAMQDIKDGFNVVKNFQAGVAYEAGKIAEEAAKKRVALEIEANERIIKERKALGKDTSALEVANNKLKIQQLDKDKLGDEDYAKQKLDLESESTVALNAEWKKRHDKYLELLKQDLDKIKENEKENFKIVQEGSKNARDLDLTDVDTKYNAELALLNKRRKENKSYNKDYSDLVTARKDEEAKINKKYDDQIFNYLDETNAKTLDKYAQKEADIKKKIDELLKTATPEEAALLQRSERLQFGQIDREKTADTNDVKAKTNVVKTEDKDRIDENDHTETVADVARKQAEITKAQIDAENASYELQKIQKAGQYDELEALDADHQKNLHDLEQGASDARIALQRAEQDAKLQSYDIVANAASAASDLIGQTTVAGKALAVASATISTYTSAQKAYESVVGIPYVGPVLAVVAAATAVAAGIANVKKILSVQVPAKSGGGGATGQSLPSAPVINSTVLQQANSGTPQLTNAINGQNQNKAPLKAYIVNKDLQDQQKQNDYYAAQSTY